MAIAHITLATRNVADSQEFFAATLGWRPIERPNNIGRPAAWLDYIFEVIPANSGEAPETSDRRE